MHARELVEIAAQIATQGPVFIRHDGPIPTQVLQRYWTASRCRLDRWSLALRDYTDRSEHAEHAQNIRAWGLLRPVLEEILTSEVLTRVWAALACGVDRHRSQDEVGPVARSIMRGHLDARNRTLGLMVYGQGFAVEEAVELNRLRRRSERWTDLLLGYLGIEEELTEFAFVPQRVLDFTADIREQSRTYVDPMAWRVVLASLKANFQQTRWSASSNPELNRRIASAVMGCLPPSLFETTGLPRGLWVERLYEVADETQGLLDQLIAAEDPTRDLNFWRSRSR